MWGRKLLINTMLKAKLIEKAFLNSVPLPLRIAFKQLG
jgi:hypothetical protein